MNNDSFQSNEDVNRADHSLHSQESFREAEFADQEPISGSQQSRNNSTFNSGSQTSSNKPDNTSMGPQPFGSVPFGGFPPYPPPPYWMTQREPQRSPGLGTYFLRFCMSTIGILVGGLCFFFLACFVLAAMLALMMGETSLDSVAVHEKTLSGSEMNPHKIAILPIEGTILGEEDGFIRNAIRQAYEDSRIAAIVLRINSPGGTMSGSDYYYHHLMTLKKERNIPIIVSMGDLAASGGYYLAMTGDKIFAERSTWTGSIGVICPLYNAADLCSTIGVQSNAITSGTMKGMGNITKPMSEEEKEIWQHLVDQSYEQFLDVVRKGRPNFVLSDNADPNDDPLRKIADGRIYSAQQAKSNGLIDEIDFLDAAVEEAINRAGCSKNKVQIVRYQEEESFFSALKVQSKDQNISKIISGISTPQVYYLCPQAIPISL
ncbi:MAG: signal peptide peptidase SppA [Planctomycetia bacterium]|nr:signal peptide peptidase SppA [Planctomycetia bacterium]